MLKYFRGYEEGLVRLVEQGITEGEFRAVDAVETAIALEGLVEGILLLWVMDPTQFDFSRQVKASARLLLEGLQHSEVKDNA